VSVVTGTGKDKYMARPKTEKELKRSHHIMLRLNDIEHDIVTTDAALQIFRLRSIYESS
jgi:hypothetical protein